MESGQASESDERARHPGDGERSSGAQTPFVSLSMPVVSVPAAAKRAALDDAEELRGPETKRRAALRVALRVRPTLGAEFDVRLRPDATLGDLRDAVADATGVDAGAQLLGHDGVPADQWERDASRLSEILPGGAHTVSLAVRASTGLSASLDAVSLCTAVVACEECASCDESASCDENASEDSDTSDEPVSPLLEMVDTIDGLSLADEPRPAAPREEPKTRLVTDASSPGHCAHCGRKCRPALRFACRCGGTYCQEHRYHDAHGCPFDARPRAVLSRLSIV